MDEYEEIQGTVVRVCPVFVLLCVRQLYRSTLEHDLYLPTAVGFWRSLTEIDVSTNAGHPNLMKNRQLRNNQLLCLPPKVGEWVSLQHVDVRTSFRMNTKTLQLAYNRLTILPDSVGKWSCLLSIDVSKCHGSAVIFCCQVSGNDLKTLPLNVNWTQLTFLNVHIANDRF